MSEINSLFKLFAWLMLFLILTLAFKVALSDRVSLVKVADQHWRIGDYNTAYEIIEPYFDDPNFWNNRLSNPYAWVVRGKINCSIGEYKKSMQFFNKAIDLSPRNETIWFLRGWAKGTFGHYKDEISDYTYAIRLNPNNSKFWLYRGIARGKQLDYVGMTNDCSKAIEYKKGNSYAWNRRGWAKEQLGQLEDAIIDYKKACELDPIPVQYQIDFIRICRRLGVRYTDLSNLYLIQQGKF